MTEVEKAWADLPDQLKAHPGIKRLHAEAVRLQANAARYEVVRRLSVPAFQDAFVLNRRTGKSFDQIIDDLAPFYGKATPQEAA